MRFEDRVHQDWEDQQHLMGAALGRAESIVSTSAHSYVPPVPLWHPGATVLDFKDESGVSTPVGDWSSVMFNLAAYNNSAPYYAFDYTPAFDRVAVQLPDGTIVVDESPWKDKVTYHGYSREGSAAQKSMAKAFKNIQAALDACKSIMDGI